MCLILQRTYGITRAKCYQENDLPLKCTCNRDTLLQTEAQSFATWIEPEAIAFNIYSTHLGDCRMWSRLLEAAQGPAEPGAREGQRALASLRQARRALRDEATAQLPDENGGIPLKELDSFQSASSGNLFNLASAATTASAASAFLRPIGKGRQSRIQIPPASQETEIEKTKRENLQLQRQLIVVTAEAEATQKVVDILVEQGDQLRLEREAERCVSRASINAAADLEFEGRSTAEAFAASKLVWKAVHNAAMEHSKASAEKLTEAMRHKEEASAEAIEKIKRTCESAVQAATSSEKVALEAKAMLAQESKAREVADQLALTRAEELKNAQTQRNAALRDSESANRCAAQATAAAARVAQDAKKKTQLAETSIAHLREGLERETARADEATRRAAVAVKEAQAAVTASAMKTRSSATEEDKAPSKLDRPRFDGVVDQDEDESMVDTFVDDDDTTSVATEASLLDRGMSRDFSRGFSEVNKMVDCFVDEEPLPQFKHCKESDQQSDAGPVSRNGMVTPTGDDYRIATRSNTLDADFEEVDEEETPEEEDEPVAQRNIGQYLEDANQIEPSFERQISKFSPEEGEEIKQVWISPRAQEGNEDDAEFWE